MSSASNNAPSTSNNKQSPSSTKSASNLVSNPVLQSNQPSKGGKSVEAGQSDAPSKTDNQRQKEKAAKRKLKKQRDAAKKLEAAAQDAAAPSVPSAASSNRSMSVDHSSLSRPATAMTAATTVASTSKSITDKLEIDDDGAEWSAGEDEDDSRPRVGLSDSNNLSNNAGQLSKSQKKKIKKQQKSKQQQQQQVAALPEAPKPQSKQPSTSAVKQPLTQQRDRTTGKKYGKQAQKDNEPMQVWDGEYVPPLFAHVGPFPDQMEEHYAAPGSKTYRKKGEKGQPVLIITTRVSLKPLPELLKQKTDVAKDRYMKANGVVGFTLNLVEEAADVQKEKEQLGDKIVVRLNGQGNDSRAPTPAPTVTLAPRPTSKEAFISFGEIQVDAMSHSASTAASTSVPTPPLPPKAPIVETTFYSSSPSLNDPAIISISRSAIVDQKSFIPASTATINAAAAQEPPKSAPSHVRQTSQDNYHDRVLYPQSANFIPAQPQAQQHTQLQSHHPHPQQLMYPSYEYPVQHIQYPDGSVWQINPHGQMMPAYYNYPAMPHPSYYYPSYPAVQPQQQHHPYPQQAPAMKYVRSASYQQQPIDSPPYSPYDSFSPVSHNHPQPHPLSLPPQLPVQSPPPVVHPANPLPSSSYTYDPATGLMTDPTGLVFAPQHAPTEA